MCIFVHNFTWIYKHGQNMKGLYLSHLAIYFALNHFLHCWVFGHLACNTPVTTSDNQYLQGREFWTSNFCHENHYDVLSFLLLMPHLMLSSAIKKKQEVEIIRTFTFFGEGWEFSAKNVIISWYEHSSRSVNWMAPSNTITFPKLALEDILKFFVYYIFLVRSSDYNDWYI